MIKTKIQIERSEFLRLCRADACAETLAYALERFEGRCTWGGNSSGEDCIAVKRLVLCRQCERRAALSAYREGQKGQP